MATIKAVVLKHQLREDGTYNIKIRVTHKRESVYIPTEHYVSSRRVSADCKKINDKFILGAIEIEIARMRQEISRLGAWIYMYSAKSLADHLDKFRKPGDYEIIDFFDFAKKKIWKIRSEGRVSTASMYQSSINNLREWLHRETLGFNEITVKFLCDYEAYLRELPRIGSRGLEANLASIRAMFNFARYDYNNEDTGEIRIPNYPFAKYKIPKAAEPDPRAVSPEIFDEIRSFDCDMNGYPTRDNQPSRPELARDVFLLSFFLVGMNSKDLYELRADQIKDGRITYQRAKTKDRRSDKAEISIKITPEAARIIQRYEDPGGERAFNFHSRYSSPATFNAALNDGLREIGEIMGVDKLQFYSARHTWATIARNDCNVSVDDIALALNHKDIDRRVTFKYIRKDFSKIDEANQKVIDFVNWIGSPKSKTV